jgi:hypothetical protein
MDIPSGPSTGVVVTGGSMAWLWTSASRRVQLCLLVLFLWPTTVSVARTHAPALQSPSSTAGQPQGAIDDSGHLDADDLVPDYDRKQWKHWIDADGDCQNTRNEVLIRDSVRPVKFRQRADGKQCVVEFGEWVDPYSGETITDPSALDIDHVVPLQLAHFAGAWQWTEERRTKFANDLTDHFLKAVKASLNRSKGAKGPDQWLPPNAASRLDYVVTYIAFKTAYDLPVTATEEDTLRGFQPSKVSTDGPLSGTPANRETEVTISLGVVRAFSFALMAGGVPFILWLAFSSEHRRAAQARREAVKGAILYAEGLGIGEVDRRVIDDLVDHHRAARRVRRAALMTSDVAKSVIETLVRTPPAPRASEQPAGSSHQFVIPRQILIEQFAKIVEAEGPVARRSVPADPMWFAVAAVVALLVVPALTEPLMEALRRATVADHKQLATLVGAFADAGALPGAIVGLIASLFGIQLSARVSASPSKVEN